MKSAKPGDRRYDVGVMTSRSLGFSTASHRLALSVLLSAAFLLNAPAVQADNYPLFGYDLQRSGWAKGENKLNKDTVKDLKLQWKLKLPGAEARELTSLTVPIILQQLIADKGFFELAFVASANDKLFAIDADSGKLFWQREFDKVGEPKGKPHWLCPFSANATPVFDARKKLVYTITSDGRLRTVYMTTGKDAKDPVPFTPPFAKPYSLALHEDHIYAVTGQGCNRAANGVYAINLADGKVSVFQSTNTNGAGIWGRAGAALGSDGSVYVETGDGRWDPATGKWADTVLKLKPKTLELADYYTPANRAWITKKDLDMGNMSPIVFPYEGKELVAASGKEGVIYLMDAARMGGEDHRTPLYRSQLLTNEEVDFAGRGFWGAMATWEDESKARWLIAPAWGPPAPTLGKFAIDYGPTPNGSIAAFKVETKDGKVVLTPAWNSIDMDVPEAPTIAGGVVFAISSGEHVRQVNSEGSIFSSADRIAKSGKAKLYALDAKTGKVLFDSKDQIQNFTHFSGVAVGAGRVYVVTHDSTVYCFGLEE
jgi:outer membrane protein assembly factor BamB